MSKLRIYFNTLAFQGLGPFPDGQMAALKDAGYDGVQFIQPLDRDALKQAHALNLGVCGGTRINTPNEADAVAQEAADAGMECMTIHLGWGMESDDEGARLIEALLAASEKHRIPLYPETHRATLFQDLQRTVQFVVRFPELRFNGDFSHWYTGSEMVYGGFEKKLAYIHPVIERVCFMHGRIGNPGCMQVAIVKGDPALYVEHFRTLWTQCFAAYLRDTTPRQSFITFTPELLAADIYYARAFNGAEESDRWQQSLLLAELAHECFNVALQQA